MPYPTFMRALGITPHCSWLRGGMFRCVKTDYRLQVILFGSSRENNAMFWRFYSARGMNKF